MRKFSVKTLLVLALVLVLVLSLALVACNKKKNNKSGGDTPTPTPTPTDSIDKDSFFTNMWDIANDIGGEAISASDNVALSLDLSLALRQIDNRGEVAEETLNVGIKLDLVYDRNSGTTAAPSAVNSGLRALVYDGATGETWLAVYYFLADPTNVYFDLNGAKNIDFLKDRNLLQGRYYKVTFVTDSNGNASYAPSVADFVNNHKFAQKENDEGELIENSGFTIRNIVDALAKDTGANWTLNNLVDNIAGAFGLDLGGLLSKVSGMIPGVYDAQTGIHLEAALSSSIVKGLLNEPTTEELAGGKKVHTVALKISGLLNLLGDSLPAGIGKFLNKDTTISVSYGEKDGKIDGFGLTLGMKSLKDKKTSLYPELSVNINNLEIRKVENSAAKVKERVEFDASKWANAETLNLNNMLNAEADMQVEVWNKGGKTTYLVTAYSDIDIINVIEQIVKMAKDDATLTRRAELLADMKFEIGLKAEELNADGTLKKDADNKTIIPFQLLASARAGELSAVVGEKTYVIDVADILGHWDTIFAEETPDPGLEPAGDDDDEEGGFDFMGLIDVISLIAENVKINGEELSMDVLKAAFLDENGELKANWHEFTLDANFTKELCNQICEKFGGKNNNEVSVLIDKDAKAFHARAEYLNDAGVDEEGKPVQGPYFVDVTSSWDLKDHTLSIELKFNMWDENAGTSGKVVTYDCTYTGSLTFVEGHEELLESGEAELKLTRQYADEQTASPVFTATLEGEINYNTAKDSITDANISLVVTNGLAKTHADFEEFFRITGTLTVSGTGKVLVKLTDDGIVYTATAGVVVDTEWEETLVKWICSLEVDQDDAKVAIHDFKIPANVLAILKKLNIVGDVAELNVGQLLDNFHVNFGAANVIKTHYTKTEDTVGDKVLEHELFWIGLNEEEIGHEYRWVFEFKREKATEKATYVRFCWNTGDGDTGLALKLDTWHVGEVGASYAGTVAAPDRTQRYADDDTEHEHPLVNVIDSSNFAEVVGGIMAMIMG